MKNRKKTIKFIFLSLSVFLAIFIINNFNSVEEKKEKYVKRKPSSVNISKNKILEVKKVVETKILRKKNKRSFYQATNKSKTLKAYKSMAHFPSYSTPIHPKQKIDFIEKQLKPDVKHALGAENPHIQFKAWSEKNFYNESDKIKMNAILSHKGKSQKSKVTALFDSGIKKDFSMDQKGHYVLIVDPSLLKTGQNSVRILTKYQNESFEILSRFHYCASDIELLGEGESSLSSQGDLLFHHEVNVLSEGNFLFEGILYQNGKMVAKAHIVKSLSEGLNLVDLKYYGFLFYDRMLSGSFELRNLQVSSIDENLN